MRKSKFTEEQIAMALRQGEAEVARASITLIDEYGAWNLTLRDAVSCKKRGRAVSLQQR